MSTVSDTSISLDDSLKQNLKFTDEDRELNREGRLSPAQISRLRSDLGDSSCMAWGCGAVCLPAFACLIFGIVSPSQALEPFTDPSITLGTMAVCLLFIVLSMLNKRRIEGDLVRGAVLSTNGAMHPSTTNNGRGVQRYLITINGEQFQIPRALYSVLPAKGVFTLYYTPTSKILVSAEYIGPEPRF